MGKQRRFEKDFYFDYHFFVRLASISKLLFPRTEWAVLFLIATLVFSAASEVLTYKTGMIPGQMYQALASKSRTQFWRTFAFGSLAYLGKCLLVALKSFSSWQLYLSWRKNAVAQLQEWYFKNHAYYSINCIDDHGIDNPDQRITQDVERMCNQLAINILPAILIGPFIVAFYTYRTYTSAGGLGIFIIYGYFVLGTIVNKFLVSPMVKWNARVEKAEGDFRYKHVSIRQNAESVAMYEAEPFEQFESNRIFMVLWWRQFKYMCWKLPNLFWQQFFDYYGAILSYAIQFIPIFITGIYDHVSLEELAKIISNNAFVYIYLVNSFTRITDVALSTGEMAGILQRVTEFARMCKHVGRSDEGYDNFATDLTLTRREDEDCLLYDIQDVSFSIPSDHNQKLLEGLTFSIHKTARVWITGPSGCGKSSLLRVLAKLWQHDSGFIRCGAKRGQILRLSQVPYFPSGRLSLFQQISFPATGIGFGYENEESDYASVAGILNALQLGWLIDRCDGLYSPVEFEWQETLTPGEQQRLAFARVIYQRPEFAVLDESTSSVGVDIEERMYQLLNQNKINYISVSHRPSLSKYHDVELRLDGQGGYTVQWLHSSAPNTGSGADELFSD